MLGNQVRYSILLGLSLVWAGWGGGLLYYIYGTSQVHEVPNSDFPIFNWLVGTGTGWLVLHTFDFLAVIFCDALIYSC